MKINRIISGGQTGADQGGLDAALGLLVDHGGYCPKGRPTEKGGTIPSKYNLVETTSADWLTRTEKNVQESDVTLIFSFGAVSGGSKRTVDFAKKHSKPYFCVDLHIDDKDDVIDFLNENFSDENITINVAGKRESKAQGIQLQVKDMMQKIIVEINKLR